MTNLHFINRTRRIGKIKPIIIALLFLSSSIKVNGQTENDVKSPLKDTSIAYFTNLNLSEFIGKTTKSFTSKLPPNHIRSYITGGSRTEFAEWLIIEYPNNIHVGIQVLEFLHMNPRNPQKLPPNQVWKIEEFKMEKINSITIHNGDICINGCE